ncbi:hypothetical protein BGX31_007879 [Mortierella sp. GBA43]|nr:hypothetical protein BGX31_007879 [Mortierella sp. GBA43]
MHEEIKTAVDTVSRKTLKARDELKRSLMGFKRLPTGVLQRALDKARTNLDLGESYSLKHFQTRLGIRKDENIRIWLHDVESRFLDAWDEELSRDGSDRPAKRQRTTEDPTEAHQTRTCTPLRQIIRPELQNHHDSIVAIADNCQEEITDTLDELSVLTLKATMAIASGAVHGTEESFFDIRAILPANFEFRDDVNPVLNVATLPSNLQEQIADMIELNTAKQDDTYSLLSQHHLQHMHNQFMGPQKSNNVTAGEQAEEPGQDRHPRWEKITRAINPSTNLSAISTFPAGLSSTMTAQIREYATAVTNLWQGSIHTKLIGYTLRVLLRLHLAPKREQKQHSRQATQDDRQNRKSSGSCRWTSKRVLADSKLPTSFKITSTQIDSITSTRKMNTKLQQAKKRKEEAIIAQKAIPEHSLKRAETIAGYGKCSGTSEVSTDPNEVCQSSKDLPIPPQA